MEKLAIILYHKNLLEKYKKRWVTKCIESLENQVDAPPVSVFECNYGSDNNKLVDILGRSIKLGESWTFMHAPQVNHAAAMNLLLSFVFGLHKFDMVFNTNVDDYFELTRLNRQYKLLKESSYHLVSSDMDYITEDKTGQDVLVDEYQPEKLSVFNTSDKQLKQIKAGNNPIAHPVVAFTREFWQLYGPYLPEEVPFEDMRLWERCLKNAARFHIIPEVLLHYRLSPLQICNKR